jgi:hypothetical protein
MDLHFAVAATHVKSRDRVLEQFEAPCIVTQSVRTGVAEHVRVIVRHGTVLTILEVARDVHPGTEMSAVASA